MGTVGQTSSPRPSAVPTSCAGGEISVRDVNAVGCLLRSPLIRKAGCRSSIPSLVEASVYYLYGSKNHVARRLVATFGSEQQLLAYVRWATLSGASEKTTK